MDAPGKDVETDQADVIAFLSSPAAHGGVAPEHVETHLSHIFLAGDRALKLKKPVRWSLVDYGTRERRAHFCRQELAVNAPFAADLYVAVRQITREGDHLAFDGSGEALDTVVEMRRFPHDAQLDVMVDAGTVDGALVDATADEIAVMHRAVPAVLTRDGADRVRAVTRQLGDDLLARLGGDAPDVERWRAAASADTERLAGLLDRRARHGFVRRCHGDLHLSNIAVWNGRPTPFDAIEFSDAVATIDVLYDLAFVLVDLELRSRQDLATRLLSRYLEARRDYAGLALLPLFASQRAMVRALVGTMKGRDPAPAIAVALRLIEDRSSPRLVAIGGRSGTGKTTVARAVAPALRAVVIRSDAVRKRLQGRSPEEPLPAEAYAGMASDAVYRRMRVDARRALRAGAAVVLDAAFLAEDERRRAKGLAQALGVRFDGVWLEAALDARLARVGGRTGDASDAGAEVARLQERDVGRIDWAIVPADGEPGAVSAAVRERLEAPMTMRAMVARAPHEPLQEEVRPIPVPSASEVLIAVTACGVCRTDLHVVDDELAAIHWPVVPGHEIVGRIAAVGPGVSGLSVGDRVGVPWLGGACGTCPYCRTERENLCDAPTFTGATRDGGYATHTVADAGFVLRLPDNFDDLNGAPLLCAGLIGFRAYRMAGAAPVLGLYGFGAAAHIIAQVAVADGRTVYAFTRPGDTASQAFARTLGVAWAGGSDEAPPAEMDAAILFAPVGALVPEALRHVKKGGRVVCAGIHMSDIPSFPYSLLWGEREVLSVANLTRADGEAFMALMAERPVAVHATAYRLAEANRALDDLRAGRLDGAAVLVP